MFLQRTVHRLICTILITTKVAGGIHSLSYLRRFIVGESDYFSTAGPAKQNDSIPYPDVSDVSTLYIRQQLDHFRQTPEANKTAATFQQRYFYTDRFVQPETSQTNQYAFLCVGGEGPALTPRVLVDSVHCTGDMIETARRLFDDGHSIHLFALEHRYYGFSYPTYSDVDFQYLSSRQALCDIAHFVTKMGLSRWITFGGSYPGMLSAWSRSKFPHLIHASVSSSAPIQAQVNNRGYNDLVAQDLMYERIGGSQKCFEIVSEGHKQLIDILKTEEGKAKVANMFNICDGGKALEIESRVQSWLGDGIILIPAQENDPSCNIKNNSQSENICNIRLICDFLVNHEINVNSTYLERLANLSLLQNSDSCRALPSWENEIKYLQYKNSTISGYKSWMYQTCTEFGFYQTCEVESSCPYAKGMHIIDQDLETCAQVYGIDGDMVRNNVQQTLEYFGGWDIDSSNILFVNGDVDPWSALALQDSTETLPVVNVVGASHHFWTHSVKSTDDKEIEQARNIIYDWVKVKLLEPQNKNKKQGKKLRFRSNSENLPFESLV
mmetsp:Transcript_3299/g.6088  ORF Transcript_3299/g.6088 Transcript_3299/m.6088 type:complete len:552 (-) Transcript_3299:124-1779(-)